MKLICLLILLATFPSPLAGQDQPKIEIINCSWHKLPKSKSPADQRAEEKRNEMIDASIRAEYQQDHPDYERVRNLEAMKKKPVTTEAPKAADKAYMYKFKLRNTASLEIVSLKWAYVFKDAATGEQLVRHSFESKVKVGPDKQKEVILFTDSGPPMVVSANAIEKGGHAWNESVIIEAVEYADGSHWPR